MVALPVSVFKAAAYNVEQEEMRRIFQRANEVPFCEAKRNKRKRNPIMPFIFSLLTINGRNCEASKLKNIFTEAFSYYLRHLQKHKHKHTHSFASPVSFCM